MHYYKRNIGDYAKKAGRLSMLEHGAYTLLLDACYDRERFPTLDEAIEWTWARTDAEIEAVKFVLSRFFTLEDGRYVQARIAEEVAKYHETSTKNAQIAAEREAKRKLPHPTQERVLCSTHERKTGLIVETQAHQGAGTRGKQLCHNGNSNLLGCFRLDGKPYGATHRCQFCIWHALLAQGRIHLLALGLAANHAHILRMAC